MLKKDLFGKIQDKVKVVMKEEFAKSTLISRGFISPDENFNKERAVLYTCLTNGKQGIYLDNILNDGDYFIIVPSQSTYTHRAKGRLNLFANELIDDEKILLSTISIETGITSRYGKTRHYTIQDSTLININNKEIEGNMDNLNNILLDSVAELRSCVITQYTKGYTEKDIVEKVYNKQIDFDNQYTQYVYFKKLITQGRNSLLATLGGNNVVKITNQPIKFLISKEGKGYKNKNLVINEINKQINKDYNKKQILNNMLKLNLSVFDIVSGAIGQVDKNIAIKNKHYDILTIRCFDAINPNPSNNKSDQPLDLGEFFRIFILFQNGKIKKKIAARKNNDNQWVSTTFPKKEKTSSWRYPLIELNSKDFFGEIQYIEEIVHKYNEKYYDNFGETIDIQNFISIIKYKDIIEKVYKVIDKEIFLNVLANNSFSNPIEILKNMLENKNITNETDVLEAIGFNNEQLKYIDFHIKEMIKLIDQYGNHDSIIPPNEHKVRLFKSIFREIKIVLGAVIYNQDTGPTFMRNELNIIDFRDIDYKTFKTILDFYFKLKKDTFVLGNSDKYMYARNLRYRSTLTLNSHELSTIMINLNIKDIEFLSKDNNYEQFINSYLNFIKLKGFNGNFSNISSIYMYYNDYCDMINGINRVLRSSKSDVIKELSFEDREIKKDIRLLLNPSELIRKHDELAVAYSLIQDESNNLLYDEIYKKNKYLEMNNNKFAIILPKKTEEIIKEGVNLNHCVGSYVTKVLNEDTLILFLRNKENINKSYFTMEISNNRLVQLRGFNNEELQDKQALNFIEKWIRKKLNN